LNSSLRPASISSACPSKFLNLSPDMSETARPAPAAARQRTKKKRCRPMLESSRSSAMTQRASQACLQARHPKATMAGPLLPVGEGAARAQILRPPTFAETQASSLSAFNRTLKFPPGSASANLTRLFWPVPRRPKCTCRAMPLPGSESSACRLLTPRTNSQRTN